MPGKRKPFSPIFAFFGGRRASAVRRRISVEHQILRGSRHFLERRFEIESVRVGGELQGALEHRRAGAGAKSAVEERARPIDNHARGIEIVFRAEAVAGRASAVRRIEAERSRLELRNGDAAVGAGQLFGKDVVGAADDRNRDKSRRQLQRRRDRLLEARGDSGLHQQPIDHHFDRVILPLVEHRNFVELHQLAVDARAEVAVLRQLLQLFAIGAFAAAHDRREDHDAVVGLAEFAGQDRLDDLLARLTRDRVAALRAVRDADRAVNDAEVVVNLGDGSDRGTRRPRRGLLLDGDGRRKPFDHIDIGALHLVEELAGVGRQRFDVTALALGINRVERERRLAGAGQAGNDRQRVPRYFDADVFQIVLARAAHNQFGQRHGFPCCCSPRAGLTGSGGAQWAQ